MKRLDFNLLKQNIEKAAEYDFVNNKVFGSAYCVIQGDETVYSNCLGYTSVETEKKVDENTLFRLASMTKPITAIAALILVERGLLSLNDEISEYLPEFKNPFITQRNDQNEFVNIGKAKKEVTVLNLLTHTSGIGSESLKSGKMTEEEISTIDNTVKFYSQCGLDFEPGTRAQYSGTGAFDVLVKIIELITKEDYLSFIKREIFEPCGMTNTTFVPTKEQWENLIDMHTKTDGKNDVKKMKDNCVFANFPCTHYLGGAGLVSTLKDYTNFAKMLLNQGKTPEKQIVSPKTFSLLSTPYFPKGTVSSNQSWGLGVRIIVDNTYNGLPVGAFGWSGAYGSHFWIDPANKIAAVFMKNSLFDGGADNESGCNFEKAVNASFT